MKTRGSIKRIGCILLFLVLALSGGVGTGFSALVEENEAVAIADLWFAMELNIGYLKINEAERLERFNQLPNRRMFYLVSKDDLLDSPPDEGRVLAFVVKYEPSGFVVVSGEDRIQPVVVFDVRSEFRWDHPERNFLRHFLRKTMESRWENLGIDVHPNWSYLRSRLQEGKGLHEVTFEPSDKQIFFLWETAHWDQAPFYNDTVIAHNGNTPGIPTGCTATAMAIKMRFHEWPLTGNSSHGYNDTQGNIQFSHFVNFAAQTYNWANMPTTHLTGPNPDVAALMYHCGVAVDMNYEVGGSGAWPTASSMNTYFRYKTSEDNESGHYTPMIVSIRGGLPVVCSSTAHTVVADGYRDSPYPYFHLNCGWHGDNDGWYDLYTQFPGGDASIDYSCPYSCPQNYIYVEGDWSGSENGSLQEPYNTVSEGESATPTGGHLWIEAGTYTGAGNVPITFDRAMMVRSYGGTATIGSSSLVTSSGKPLEIR